MSQLMHSGKTLSLHRKILVENDDRLAVTDESTQTIESIWSIHLNDLYTMLFQHLNDVWDAILP